MTSDLFLALDAIFICSVIAVGTLAAVRAPQRRRRP